MRDLIFAKLKSRGKKVLRKYNTLNFIVTCIKTSIQVFRLLGEYIRVSVQRMSLFDIIWLRLAELVPVTLPQYSLQICHRHACWLPIVLCDQLLEPLHDAFFNFRSVDFRNQFNWNFQPSFTEQLSGDLRWSLSAQSRRRQYLPYVFTTWYSRPKFRNRLRSI